MVITLYWIGIVIYYTLLHSRTYHKTSEVAINCRKWLKIAINSGKWMKTALTLYWNEILTSNIFWWIPELTTKHLKLLEIIENGHNFVLDWDIEPKFCISYSANYHKKSVVTRIFWKSPDTAGNGQSIIELKCKIAINK